MCAAALSSDHEIRGGEMDRSRPKRNRTMNIARAYNNWVKYRQTVTELGRMTNRELSDLGIAREDIRKVARKAVL
jgi:uncharacterized protein YjiS (DUF1127 family)